MINRRIFGATLLVAAIAPLAELAAATDRNIPTDVADYAVRRAGCNHWTGEEPYDAARGREIAAVVEQLRCESLDAEEKTLRRRHRHAPALLRELDRANEADG